MKSVFAVLSFACFLYGTGQNAESFWKKIMEADISPKGTRQIVPQKYLSFHLNGNLLKEQLWTAPSEKLVSLSSSTCIIYLPIANGNVQAFKVVEAPVMEPALSAAYPNIKTFSIKGIDDPYAGGKLDWNDFGFLAEFRKVNRRMPQRLFESGFTVFENEQN